MSKAVCRQKNHKIELSGVSDAPIVLHDCEQRFSQAQENIISSHGLPDGIVPVFLGVEHALILNKEQVTRPCVVIEKSRLLLEAYDAQHISLPEHCKFVVGEWGYYFPSSFSSQVVGDRSFIFEEIGDLIQKLRALPTTLFENMQIYFLPEHASETVLNSYLMRALVTLSFSGQYHRDRQAQYKAFQKQAKSRSVVWLLQDLKEIKETEHSLESILKGYDVRFFECSDHGNPHLQMVPFGITSFERDDLSSAAFLEKSLKPFVDQADRLFEFLVMQPPQFVACHNRSVFNSFEDMLFLEQMLIELKLPQKFFYRDLIGQTCLYFRGGWSDELYRDHNSQHVEYFCVDPVDASLHQTENTRMLYYPKRHFHDVPTLKPPVPLTRTNCDVAIVHGSRVAALQQSVFVELYDVIAALVPQGLGKALLNVCATMRNKFRNNPHSYYFITAINNINAFFYAIYRIKEVQKIVETFSDLDVHVYGDGWQEVLPDKFCQGYADASQLSYVYRHAKVVVSVSLDHTYFDPHPNGLQAMANGGLTLFTKPVWCDVKNPYGFKSFADDLVYYDSIDQLAELIGLFSQESETREKMVLEIQNKSLKPLFDHDKSYDLADLQKMPIQSEWLGDINPMDDSYKNKVLLTIFEAYLYKIMGFRDVARSLKDSVGSDLPSDICKRFNAI